MPVVEGEIRDLVGMVRALSSIYKKLQPQFDARHESAPWYCAYKVQEHRGTFLITPDMFDRNPVWRGVEAQMRMAGHVALAKAVVSQLHAERLAKESAIRLACQEYQCALEAYVEWGHARAGRKTKWIIYEPEITMIPASRLRAKGSYNEALHAFREGWREYAETLSISQVCGSGLLVLQKDPSFFGLPPSISDDVLQDLRETRNLLAGGTGPGGALLWTRNERIEEEQD